jgi:hypothetical protein
LPEFCIKLLNPIAGQKITLSFSSIQMPGYDWGDYHMQVCNGFQPSNGGVSLAVSCVSCDKTFKLGIITDKYSLKHPQEFVNIFDE